MKKIILAAILAGVLAAFRRGVRLCFIYQQQRIAQLQHRTTQLHKRMGRYERDLKIGVTATPEELREAAKRIEDIQKGLELR